MINKETLNRALAYYGSRRKLAKAAGLSIPAVRYWIYQEGIPSLLVAARIEKDTKGEIKATDWVIL